MKTLRKLTDEILAQEEIFKQGGGSKGKERQKNLGRLTARERLEHLLDHPQEFLELGIWQGYEMYSEWGGLPAAGVVTGIGKVSGRPCMIIANDATVKAGAFFPQSVKKVLRAQKIALKCKIPLLYLVDSSGVFLPLQDEIFPDEDDFGRIFYYNSILSAEGIPQIAAIMGDCIAGGGYLPVLCDTLLMTEGSGLYLAGPALVKAAIGHEVDAQELGGAKMHSQISGTVDFREPNDPACLDRIRKLIASYPLFESQMQQGISSTKDEKVYELVSAKEYDVRDLLSFIIDKDSFQEYKGEYGLTLVCGFAKIGGCSVGVVANQRMQTKSGTGEIEIGGVVYSDSADKAARFVMDCNQMKIPLIFFQDVVGFMVGKAAEQSGIIRSGAKLVNAVSNSIVPKITVITGNSFGAGNYALCGKAYDPVLVLAWPNAKYAVMGAEQAANTLLHIQKKGAERKGISWDAADSKQAEILEKYQRQMDIRYGAARGWVDAIITPHQTRSILKQFLETIPPSFCEGLSFKTGIFQV